MVSKIVHGIRALYRYTASLFVGSIAVLKRVSPVWCRCVASLHGRCMALWSKHQGNDVLPRVSNTSDVSDDESPVIKVDVGGIIAPHGMSCRYPCMIMHRQQHYTGTHTIKQHYGYPCMIYTLVQMYPCQCVVGLGIYGCCRHTHWERHGPSPNMHLRCTLGMPNRS